MTHEQIEDVIWDNMELIESKEMNFTQLAKMVGVGYAKARKIFFDLGGESPRDKERGYIVYKKGNFICSGTLSEVAKHLGVKERSVKSYSDPKYRVNANRLHVEKVDLDALL